jgi:ubiquinone/menaquinone biosynthesis C-methylase UbiE
VTEYKFKKVDFEHPSFLFSLEDKLKGLVGGPLLYDSYYRSFGLKGDEMVLDFGCGGGAGSKRLAGLLNNNGHLTCIDISTFWISRAVKRLKRFSNVDCNAGDIRELDIDDSSFDIITIFHVIHDIDPDERQDIVKVLSRKLKTGGILYIREPVKVSHGMPAEEIRALLSAVGLQEIQYEQTKAEYTGKYSKTN